MPTDKDTGPTATTPTPGDTTINRGYQTRTGQCFGYNINDRQWYVWEDDAFTKSSNEEGGEDDGSRSDDKAVMVEIPNTRRYGYDRYLTLNSFNYEGTLSIQPVGKFTVLFMLLIR